MHEDSRFPWYAAYRNGSKIAEGPTPVPEDVAEMAHEIRWLDFDPANPPADDEIVEPPLPVPEGEAAQEPDA